MKKIVKYITSLLFIIPVFSFGQVSVVIPDTTLENSNSFSIPIYVSKLDGFNVRSYAFHLEFDKDLFEFRDAIVSGTLTNRRTWNVSADPDKDGVEIEAAGWTSLTGSGVLIYVSFDIKADNGYSDLKIDKFRFNYYNYPRAFIDNGSITIESFIEVSFFKSGKGNGNISIDDTKYNLPLTRQFKKNRSYLLKAQAFSSSVFDKWSGGINSKSNPIEYRAESSTEIFVNFDLKTFNVTSTINPEGFGIVEGLGVYEYGNTVTLKATPYDGKEFLNWTMNEDIISESSVFEFEIKTDINVSANFISSFFQVTASASPIDGGQISGTGLYYPDQMVVLEAKSNANWTFLNWTENNVVISEDSILYFVATGDRSLTAIFENITDINGQNQIISTKLFYPFPNPFNPTTTFRFNLAENSEVNLFLLDVKGEIVKRIIDTKRYNKGEYNKLLKMDNLSSGVYFYYFEAFNNVNESKYLGTGKVIYLK